MVLFIKPHENIHTCKTQNGYGIKFYLIITGQTQQIDTDMSSYSLGSVYNSTFSSCCFIFYL